MYHSHVSEVNDTNAGLIGPIVITKKGMASENTLIPKDVKRSLPSFSSIRRVGSRYLDVNLNNIVNTLDGAMAMH